MFLKNQQAREQAGVWGSQQSHSSPLPPPPPKGWFSNPPHPHPQKFFIAFFRSNFDKNVKHPRCIVAAGGFLGKYHFFKAPQAEILDKSEAPPRGGDPSRLGFWLEAPPPPGGGSQQGGVWAC